MRLACWTLDLISSSHLKTPQLEEQYCYAFWFVIWNLDLPTLVRVCGMPVPSKKKGHVSSLNQKSFLPSVYFFNVKCNCWHCLCLLMSQHKNISRVVTAIQTQGISQFFLFDASIRCVIFWVFLRPITSYRAHVVRKYKSYFHSNLYLTDIFFWQIGDRFQAFFFRKM